MHAVAYGAHRHRSLRLFWYIQTTFFVQLTLYCSVALNAFLLTTCTCVQFVINICPVHVLYEW
jgi:hypothetical protein